MEKKSRSRIRDENLVSEYLNSLMQIRIPDPRFGILSTLDPGYWIWDGKRWSRDKHPGPAARPPVHREKNLENKISIQNVFIKPAILCSAFSPLQASIS
jgi:hypothetical protein